MPESSQDEIVQNAYAALREADSGAAVAVILRQAASIEEAMRVFADLARRLYWQDKDLPGYLTVAHAGITYGLTSASVMGTDRAEEELRTCGLVKGIAYDVGSFTWPGWMEPGIEIGPSDLAAGMDAAKMNLRLAGELQKGDIPLSRAHWLVGAHHLAAGDYSSARSSFEEAEAHARAADKSDAELLNRGYACLAASVAEDSGEYRAQLASIKERLASVSGGAGLAEQLATAEKWLAGMALR